MVTLIMGTESTSLLFYDKPGSCRANQPYNFEGK